MCETDMKGYSYVQHGEHEIGASCSNRCSVKQKTKEIKVNRQMIKKEKARKRKQDGS